MIPEPSTIQKKPVFGELTPIYIGNIYSDAMKAEKAAEQKVNNCLTIFRLKEKKIFDALFPNMKTAQNIAARMQRYKDKKWKFDAVEYKVVRREEVICQQL